MAVFKRRVILGTERRRFGSLHDGGNFLQRQLHVRSQRWRWRFSFCSDSCRAHSRSRNSHERQPEHVLEGPIGVGQIIFARPWVRPRNSQFAAR